MSVSSEKARTLNLKIGSDVFPIEKTFLEKLSLFQKNPSLLKADEYEVQSQVSLSVFSAFVYILEGGPIRLCDSTFEFFRVLAEEFGFEVFSPSRDSPGDRTIPVGRRSVTLTVKGRSTRYEVLRTVSEIEDFATDLIEADEGGIVIDRLDKENYPMQSAIACVYTNTKESLPDTNAKTPFLALILWVIGKRVHYHTIDTVACCFVLLDMIAPTGFEKGRLLLLSQCDADRPDDFVLLPTADWTIVRDAVLVLESQKNRRAKEAKALLQRLQENEEYKPMHWAQRGQVDIRDPQTIAAARSMEI
jgi:hypothetical protein